MQYCYDKSEKIKHIELRKTPTASTIQVSFNCNNIIELTKGIEIYIYYWLKTENITATSSS
jgi:hypothetical protein